MEREQVVRRRVVLRGQVQGVGFRYGVVRRAESAGVTGWVRNRPDGAVEAALEGSAEAVDGWSSGAATGRAGRVSTACRSSTRAPKAPRVS
jgi:acylphosphatase